MSMPRASRSSSAPSFLLVGYLLPGAGPPAVLLPALHPGGDAIDGKHTVRVENQLSDVLSLSLLDGFAGCMNLCSLVCLSPRKSNSHISGFKTVQRKIRL